MPNIDSITSLFRARFENEPTVVARAPGRVNLIGEHTDYNDGFVLPLAIEQATFAACRARSDGVARVYSANEDDTQTWSIAASTEAASSSTLAAGSVARGNALSGAAPIPLADEVESPTQLGRASVADVPNACAGLRPWARYVYGVAAMLRRRGAWLSGFDLAIDSDVPLGGGLSSSASLEAACALALANLAGEPIVAIELADLCRAAEHEYAGVPCGIMDQFASVFGRAGSALLIDCRLRTVEPVPLPDGAFELVVVDSGVRHALADGEYAKRQADCRAAVEYFRRLSPGVRALRDVTAEQVRAHAMQLEPVAAARALHVTSENARVLAAAAALKRGDLETLGRLMSESHRSLRDDYEVSCAELDRLVDVVGGVAGVLGARMTGGGFGGCIVALARASALPAIVQAVRERYDPTVSKPARVQVVRAGEGAKVLRSGTSGR